MTVRFALLFGLLISVSACNQAFMQGLAEGLANRPSTVYTPTSSSSSGTNTLDNLRQKREARKQEKNMKSMCEASGGRWRVGRCKY